MNILFLSLSKFEDINTRGIYSDLMRELIRRGNDLYIASPTERRYNQPTHLIVEEHCHILRIKTLNIRNTNIIEKGLATLLLEWQFDKAIRKYWGTVKFDLVLYSTPPITFNKVIKDIKQRCGCRSYLMLKDIFPQNAVDLGMMSEGGLIHKFFRKKEKRLYEISDKIGCMSPANCKYIIDHNPQIDPTKVELCPNAIEVVDSPKLSETEDEQLRRSYDIPTGKTIFVYGGNLGKPQGLDFLLRVLEVNENRTDSFIIVVGTGTEFCKIDKWFKAHNPLNAKLIPMLPKDEYDKFIKICQVGLIFLDPRFTIPNFPSRLLAYLENSMPVLLATDKTTDMRRVVENEGIGLWAENGDIDTFISNMDLMLSMDIEQIGKKGREYLIANHSVSMVADTILNSI